MRNNQLRLIKHLVWFLKGSRVNNNRCILTALHYSFPLQRILIVIACFLSFHNLSLAQSETKHKAPAPLYRDPIYDGAADPVLIWNQEEQSWWMLYTARRANSEAADVAYCYGADIGIASSKDNGQTWVYRGSLDLEFEHGKNTFWAPDVVYHNGTYYLFVAYIQGVRNHWGGKASIVQYSSKNLWDWQYEGPVKLPSGSVIDAALMQMPDKKWKIWYKDEEAGSITMSAQSTDLMNWEADLEPAIGGESHEGPNVFEFKNWYWMLTDEWHGMRVYRSKDAKTWEKQGLILDKPSSRPEDTPSGAHGDVVVVGEKAYIFYFTHPGRKSHTAGDLDENGVLPYALRRSSIQVAEIKLENGQLTCLRDEDFDFWLPNLNDE